MSPTTETSHVSDISYKACMGKTVIYHTLAMSTFIIYLLLMHGHHMYVYSYVEVHIQECLRTQDSLQYRGVYLIQHEKIGLICTQNLTTFLDFEVS